MSEEDATAFKPPVHVTSKLDRRSDGSYEVGACFDRGKCFWLKLTARRRDKAREQVSEAIARLMVEHAERLEEQARELSVKAKFLRDCARVKGVL